MVSVDTNVLVRLIVGDDPNQVIRAEVFVEKGAWVSHLVLAETVWALGSVYEFSDAQIVRGLEMLLKHKSLSIEGRDTVISALKLLSSKPKLRFTDCLILEIARKAGHLPLGTFDRGLAKLEGAARL